MEQTSAAPDLRYPIGPFEWPESVTPTEREQFIAQIAALPGELRAAVAGLDETQLDTPYRAGGWTLRQVVHHLADSHINSYVRFRLTLTEDLPAVKTYQEQLWGELPDARTAPVEVSLVLLEALHHRWVLLLRGMSDADFARCFQHPSWGPMRLDRNLAVYAWHCRHHLAHVTGLRERLNWR